MKISDAKQKWCPFARELFNSGTTSMTPPSGAIVLQPTPPAAGFNRDAFSDNSVPRQSCRCLADKCMAWRTVLSDPADGHCGLAGFQSHGG